MTKTVVHFKGGIYLPLTNTWIYGQIANLRRYRPIVFTFKTDNLDLFPTEEIYALYEDTGRLSFFFNRAVNKVTGMYPYFFFRLKKERPAVIHVHFGPAGYMFLPFKRWFRIPMVTSFYGYDMSMLPEQNPSWKLRYRQLFEEGDLFLVEGNHMRQGLIELGCPADKVRVQHLGVDLNRIPFIPRHLRVGEPVRVLIAASFREKKGIPYAVEAFARIRARHPKIELTIIGESEGVPAEELEKRKILEMVEQFHLHDAVCFMGYQPHHELLRQALRHHIFISPSIRASDGDIEGGAPVVIEEMSASGMPILSTQHCDIPEVVLDGESGFLVPEHDTDALTERLEFLVSNPGQWRTMGQNGREHIARNFCATIQAARLESLYDEFAR
jgi:colanic acid/amylovoran biosynthesis glycosyltransferase